MSDPIATWGVFAPLVEAFAKAKALLHGLSRPARVMVAGTTAAAVLLGGFIAFQQVSEVYTPLFTQLDRDDAAAIAAKLKEQKVAYKIDPDGATIEVPEAKARELRLELASAGLPRGGGVGFESFDKMRLGATDFEQRVLFKRALEGELTRTIDSLGAVASSRVHIVLPEKSVFVSRGEPASASVVLHLRPGRTLGASEVGSVVHLVASAVPGLDPDHIAVVTTEGAMLRRPRKTTEGSDSNGLGGDEDSRNAARAYETALEDRVRAMLERVVGPGHADVRVTADVDPARVERLEERYDPSKSVLRSEEQSVERTAGEQDNSVAGVPGAESNLPSGASKASASVAAAGASAAPSASAATAASGSSSAMAVASPLRESHTRNYEVDHVSEKRIVGAGAVRRLNVAVVLDGVKTDVGVVPRPREEMEKLAALVRSAAGVNESRGDGVALESMPFAIEAPEQTAKAPAGENSLLSLGSVRRWAPVAAGLILLALVAAVVGATRMRRARAERAAQAPAQLVEGEAPAVLAAAAQPAALDSGDLRTRAHARAAQDPATAALVLRFWLGTVNADKDGLNKS
ncbi:MAG: flagellar basal-body MS-ring/collar protein FliF [Polyangiaceae bacterium]